MRTAYKTWAFWVFVALVTVFDYVTKVMAVNNLQPRHIPHEVFGNVVRFTLAYNPGAAFGMHLGPASVGVPVVIGGAIGNLLDRIRQREGVVDFIDIGIGDVRFWTFNVADSAVTVGAICLIIALWQEERAQASANGQSLDAEGTQATRQSTS